MAIGFSRNPQSRKLGRYFPVAEFNCPRFQRNRTTDNETPLQKHHVQYLTTIGYLVNPSHQFCLLLFGISMFSSSKITSSCSDKIGRASCRERVSISRVGV